MDEQRGRDVARWAMRALPRFPASVLRTEAAMMLWLGASARLDDRRILQNADLDGALPQDVAWALPKDRRATRVRLGVRLSAEGLEFLPAQENEGNTIGRSLRTGK